MPIPTRTRRKQSNPTDKQPNGLYIHSSPPRVLQLTAQVKQLIRGGDVDKLEQLVLDGHGKKLVGEYSADYKTRTFLKNIPNLISKISLLHDAVNSGRVEELQTLLEEEPIEKRKKLVTAKDESGVGLLHKAVYYDLKNIYKYLVEKYPHIVSIKDSEGRAAYHYTPMCRDCASIQKMLVTAGADSSALDSSQHTAKYYQNHVQELELPSPQKSATSSSKSATRGDGLNFKKSNIRIWIHQRNLGNLQQVVWEGHGSMLLVEHSNNPKIKKFLEAVPHIMGLIKDIHTDVQNDDLDNLKKHASSPAPPIVLSGKDANGLTPLHKASGLGKQEIAEFIVQQYPQSVNITDCEGRTPLHYSVLAKDDGKMTNFLLDNGADESTLDNKQKTAAYYKTRTSELDAKLLTIIPECPRTAKDSFLGGFDWNMLTVLTPTEDIQKVAKKVVDNILGDAEKEHNAEEPHNNLENGVEVEDNEKEHHEEESNNNLHEENGVDESTEKDQDTNNNEEIEQNEEDREEDKTEENEAPEEEPYTNGLEENNEEETVAENDFEPELEGQEVEEPKSRPASEMEGPKTRPGSKMVESQPSRPASEMAEGQPSRPASKMVEGQPSRPASRMVEGQPSRPASKMMEGQPSRPASEMVENRTRPGSKLEEQGVEPEGVIEGVVNGENEVESTNEQGLGAESDDEEISSMIEEGNMEKLAAIVLRGDGDKLVGQKSSNPELQSFLENVSVYMAKINRIHLAARNGSLKDLQAALDRRKFAIAKDKISVNGASPLHTAVVFGHTSIVRYLAGRFPETALVMDDNGRTPLHYAAVLPDNGHYYNLLVHLGADVRVEDKFGHTPDYYRNNRDDFSHRSLLRDFGVEESASEEILSDKVPDDTYSARKDLDDEDMLNVLERCYNVLHGRRNSNAISATSTNTVSSSNTTNGSSSSLISRHMRRYVFDVVRTRLTRLDHNLYDLIWPSVKKLPTEVSFRIALEQDFPAGIVAPDLYCYKVFAEFLEPIVKDYNSIDIHQELSEQPESKFSANPDGDEIDVDVDPQCRWILSGNSTNGGVDMPFFATEEGRYLASSLGDPLIKGLTEVANKRPDDPIAYLATYLYNFANNRQAHSRGKLQENQQMITGPPQNDNNAVPATIDVVTVEPDDSGDEEDSAFNSTSRDEHGQSMLHFAAARGHGKNALFNLLEETEINVAYRDELYRTARDISIQANLADNTNELDRYVMTIATKGDTDKLVELLLDGYDHITDIIDENNVPIMEAVSQQNQPNTVSFLQSILAFEEKRERVHHAIRQGSINEVTELLADENDTGSGKLLAIGKNNYGRCSLHIAVLCQQEEIVDYLANTFPETLKLGDNLERTALHYAMGVEKMESISRVLIKAGAKRVVKDLKGRQPTYYFLNKSDILRLQEEEETI